MGQVNVGVGGVKKVSKLYAGVGGVVKQIKKGLCGVGGVVKEFFTSELVLSSSNFTSISYGSVTSSYLYIKSGSNSGVADFRTSSTISMSSISKLEITARDKVNYVAFYMPYFVFGSTTMSPSSGYIRLNPATSDTILTYTFSSTDISNYATNYAKYGAPKFGLRYYGDYYSDYDSGTAYYDMYETYITKLVLY